MNKKNSLTVHLLTLEDIKRLVRDLTVEEKAQLISQELELLPLDKKAEILAQPIYAMGKRFR